MEDIELPCIINFKKQSGARKLPQSQRRSPWRRFPLQPRPSVQLPQLPYWFSRSPCIDLRHYSQKRHFIGFKDVDRRLMSKRKRKLAGGMKARALLVKYWENPGWYLEEWCWFDYKELSERIITRALRTEDCEGECVLIYLECGRWTYRWFGFFNSRLFTAPRLYHFN